MATRADTETATGVNAAAGPAFDPQSVSFVSTTTGWAWGPESADLSAKRVPGVLAETTDGGRRWRTVVTPPLLDSQAMDTSAVRGVKFVSRSDGYLYGGTLLSTSDGGRDWTREHVPGYVLGIEQLRGVTYALACYPRDAGGCRHERLYRVEQQGRSFAAIRTPRRLWGMFATAMDGTIYVFAPTDMPTATGILWSFTPPGRWRRVGTPCWSGGTAAVAAWSADGLALACGGEPGAGTQMKCFYRSTDGGAHWQLRAKPALNPNGKPATGGYVAGLAAANSSTWVLADARYALLTTHDSGRGWRDTTSARLLNAVAGDDGFGSVTYIGHGRLIALPGSPQPLLALSTNDGRSWTEIVFRRQG